MTQPFHNAKGFVEYAENALGWAPPITATVPRWRAITIEAGKVNRKVATDPDLYSWINIALTVEWLRKKKKVVKTPTAVLFHVKDALKDSATPVKPKVVADVTLLVEQAVAYEQQHHVPGWQGWVSRLTRAKGPGKQETYDEWKAARNQ